VEGQALNNVNREPRAIVLRKAVRKTPVKSANGYRISAPL